MDGILCAIELCFTIGIFIVPYIFAGYSFVTRVFSRESKIYKLNDGNYLQMEM